jgi:hypothetical protein
MISNLKKKNQFRYETIGVEKMKNIKHQKLQN